MIHAGQRKTGTMRFYLYMESNEQNKQKVETDSQRQNRLAAVRVEGDRWVADKGEWIKQKNTYISVSDLCKTHTPLLT